MGAALGSWGTSWIPQLSLDAVVSGASCSAVTPWSSWQSWMRAADIPDVEQSREVLFSSLQTWIAHISASPSWAQRVHPPGLCLQHTLCHMPQPWADVEEKVLMSLPTINLSAWGVLKPEPVSPPPALTHVNKRFLNANKKAAAPAHQVRGPGSLGRHFTNVFFAFSGFWLVNKIEEKYSFP